MEEAGKEGVEMEVVVMKTYGGVGKGRPSAADPPRKSLLFNFRHQTIRCGRENVWGGREGAAFGRRPSQKIDFLIFGPRKIKFNGSRAKKCNLNEISKGGGVIIFH